MSEMACGPASLPNPEHCSAGKEPLASVSCTCIPIAPHCRFDPQPFRVLLLRRHWLPLPSVSHNCRCEPVWPKQRPEESLGICVREFEAEVGAAKVFVCWSAGEDLAPTVSPHHHGGDQVTTAICCSLSEGCRLFVTRFCWTVFFCDFYNMLHKKKTT